MALKPALASATLAVSMPYLEMVIYLIELNRKPSIPDDPTVRSAP